MVFFFSDKMTIYLMCIKCGFIVMLDVVDTGKGSLNTVFMVHKVSPDSETLTPEDGTCMSTCTKIITNATEKKS